MKSIGIISMFAFVMFGCINGGSDSEKTGKTDPGASGRQVEIEKSTKIDSPTLQKEPSCTEKSPKDYLYSGMFPGQEYKVVKNGYVLPDNFFEIFQFPDSMNTDWLSFYYIDIDYPLCIFGYRVDCLYATQRNITKKLLCSAMEDIEIGLFLCGDTLVIEDFYARGNYRFKKVLFE